MLGFGGGVMLAASAFSLIVPGTEAAIWASQQRFAIALGISRMGAALIMAVGILLGGCVLLLSNKYLPHEWQDFSRVTPFLPPDHLPEFFAYSVRIYCNTPLPTQIANFLA